MRTSHRCYRGGGMLLVIPSTSGCSLSPSRSPGAPQGQFPHVNLSIYAFFMAAVCRYLLGKRFRYLLRAFLYDLLPPSQAQLLPLLLELTQEPLDHLDQGRLLIDLRFIRHHQGNCFLPEVEKKRRRLLPLTSGIYQRHGSKRVTPFPSRNSFE